MFNYNIYKKKNNPQILRNKRGQWQYEETWKWKKNEHTVDCSSKMLAD